MEIQSIAIRVVFAWVFLTVLLRLSGKESVSQLSGRALIVTIVTSDLIDDFLFAAVSASEFVTAAGTLMLCWSLLSLAAVYSNRVYQVIEGDAPVLLSTTGLDRAAMRRQRINDKELAELLRLQEIDRDEWLELQAVRLEREGQASAVKHDWARPLRRSDLAGRRS